jgi:asparagine synthase (glutamine-hydrolysing)
MCGIAGLVGSFVPDLGVQMNRAQRHRGPDGNGVFEDPSAEAMLAHVRLAILDLSAAAAQPMTSPDGRFILSYNGEIYNYQELRRELEADGCVFRSTSDTEVLLLGLQRKGKDYLERLNGMFAFALWDRSMGQLLLARDPLGVKPLYYCEPKPGAVLFASEIKALFAHPDLPRSPEPEALLQHLAFSHACGELTALRGIRRLPLGSYLLWNSKDRSSKLGSYWKSHFGRRPEVTRSDAVGALKATLRQAVQRQMMSDVPVGVFFSGGVDSTLIAGLVDVERRRREFHAYTITYPSTENTVDVAEEDTPFARRAADALGLSHIEWEIKPDVTDLWPKLVHQLDEPIADPAAIACYLISRLARNNRTKVLLSGQGGDELFGGYPRYRAMSLSSNWEQWPGFLRATLSRAGRMLPGAREGRVGATIRRIRRFLVALEQDPDRRFMSYCASTPDAEISGVFSPEFADHLQSRLPADSCIERMNREHLQGVDRWLERDLSVYLPNHNLLYTDKMGMAAGVEARVPLLDLEVVKMVTAMPWEWKLRGGITKAILREAARGVISDEVIERPKAGFGAPYRKWLRYDLSEMWEDLTSEEVVRKRGWFDHAALKRIRDLSQSGKQDLYMLQWAVLTIELWARQFIDRNPSEGL